MILAACFGVLCATSAWAIAIQGWLGRTLKAGPRFGYAMLCILIVSQTTLSPLWCLGVLAFITVSLYFLHSSKVKTIESKA